MTSQLRDRVLSEWRGLPQRMPRPDRAAPIARVLDGALRSLGLSGCIKEAEILGAWREIVGEFNALHSQPAQIKNGVLTVHVLQSALHYELDRVLKQQILAKLKKRFGARMIRDVKFRVG